MDGTDDGLMTGDSDEAAALPEAKAPLVSLTTLELVPITKVWPTEPYHFTPWLLNHSEHLSEAR